VKWLNPDGTPTRSNNRAFSKNAEDFWFGFEQEYVIQAKMVSLLVFQLFLGLSCLLRVIYYCGIRGTENCP